MRIFVCYLKSRWNFAILFIVRVKVKDALEYYLKQTTFTYTKEGIIHEYKLIILFKETNSIQNYNQGKSFSGVINISEDHEYKYAYNTFKEGTIAHKMLSDNCAYADNTSSPYVTSETGINFGKISSDTNGKGLYYTTDLTRTEDINEDGEGEKVYYYRGAVENNYLVFGEYLNDYTIFTGYNSAETASREFLFLEKCNENTYYNNNCTEKLIAPAGSKMCWRIVRTNENGSVRLRYNGIYNGNECIQTGNKISIINIPYNNKTAEEKNMFYAYKEDDGSVIDSYIKETNENWYLNNIENNVNAKKLISDEPFCDYAGTPNQSSTGGYQNYIFYDAATRLLDYSGEYIISKSGAKPQYKCTSKIIIILLLLILETIY